MTVEKTQENLSTTLSKTEQSLNGLETTLDNNVGESREANNGLPEGWADCKLMELGEIVTGNTPSKKNPEYYGGKFPIFKPGDLGSSKGISEASEYLSETGKQVSRFIPAFSTYVTCIGATISKTGYSTVDGTCNQQINAITSNCYVNARWLYFLMVSPSIKNKIITSASNTTLPILNKSRFSDLQAVLPPLAEQTVIAQTLDTLLAQVDNIKTRLDAIPKILKTFRQSVLAAAVSGKLTEEWREESKEKVKWIEVQFSELLEQLRSGSADTPNGDSSGVAILRSSAVRSMTIDYSDIKFLDSSVKLNESNFLRKGDLIFTRLSGSAEYVGNCALVGELSHSFQYPDRLFCARLIDQRHAKYLEYFFASNVFRLHVLGALKSSAGHQRITLDVIKKAIVTLPPIEEQTQIVHRVEELFAFADQIEQQVKNAQGRVNNLTQSILAKAFRGELTADWRGENPELITGENSAEALLIKIQAEREKLKPKKKSSVKKTTRKKTTAMKAS